MQVTEKVARAQDPRPVVLYPGETVIKAIPQILGPFSQAHSKHTVS